MSQTREQLKEIATEQICAKNLAAASFREMGKAAGIKSSSVHYHFKSRDALLLELLKDYQGRFFTELSSRTGDSSSPKQRLHTLFDLFNECKEQEIQCLVQAYSAEAHELNEETRVAINEFYDGLYDWVLESLSSARFLPVARESLARVVVASIQGALIADRAKPEGEHLSAVEDWLATLSSI